MNPQHSGSDQGSPVTDEIGEATGPTMSVALTVAGSDSGGGAGIQADLKTFEAFGVFGTTAITAVTAQNTLGVALARALDPGLIVAQIQAVVSDLSPSASKAGMLATAEIVSAVADVVRELSIAPLVVDPVMVATSGDRLLDEEAVAVLRAELLPLAALVTPNLPEAELLTGREVRTRSDMSDAARALVDAGAAAALIKGGHLASSEIVDVLWDGDLETVWEGPRLPGSSTHGTGCTLSAAITAGLALDGALRDSVDVAIRYTRRAIERAPAMGAGRGPLNHRGANPHYSP